MDESFEKTQLPCDVEKGLQGLPCDVEEGLQGLSCDVEEGLQGLPCDVEEGLQAAQLYIQELLDEAYSLSGDVVKPGDSPSWDIEEDEYYMLSSEPQKLSDAVQLFRDKIATGEY